MKNITILIILCVLLASAGCQGKSAAEPEPKNTTDANSQVNDNEPQNDSDPSADSAQADDGASPHGALPPAPSGDIVEIKEKMFIAQTNDIYYNADDYLGKTLKYEGFFDIYKEDKTNRLYFFVIRYGPGCCGIDANAGFEVVWDQDYPNQDDWVEAVGVLEDYEDDGYHYLRVALTSLTVLDEPGAKYVSQ